MRDYAKIVTSVWGSKKLRNLKNNDRAKLLYFYFHSCPQVSSVGCYRISLGYAMADLLWSEEQVAEAIEALKNVGLIEWNADEEIIRIVNFIAHDPPTNPKHAAAMAKQALSLPDCREKLAIMAEMLGQKHVADRDRLSAELDRLSRTYTEPIHPDLSRPEPVPEPKSASADLVRARDEDASQLQKLCRHFGLDENDYLKHQANLEILIRLKEAGCDFERHIWPAALKCRNGKRINGLGYIEPIAFELRDAERSIASIPVVFEDTDDHGWRNRLRVFRGPKRLWTPKWGPAPDEPDCRVPAHLLEDGRPSA